VIPAFVRAIFFDAGGTLIHPAVAPAAVYHEVGRRFGSRLDPATLADRFRRAFRRQEDADRTAGWRTDEARERQRWWAILAEVLDDVTEPEACYTILYDHFARPDAWRADLEAADLLRSLASRGYQLGLVSNFDARLRPITAGLPALAPLQHRVISSEVGWRKPAAELFRELERVTGLAPAEILVVGDDPVNDYEGARQAGLAAVLFDPRGQRREVRARIERLSDLLPGPSR
jgi:putative hydrolase of the HAD superfamily